MLDPPSRERVVPRLRGRFGKPQFLYVERCPSTQRLFPEDAPEGAVAVAEEQTEGRGRLGRRWIAPARTSLLCSIVLRPSVPPERLPELTIVAARACAEALRSAAALEPEVRFPNDVLVGGRKVAGILGEAAAGRVVLGIGVNVNLREDELPREVDVPATSLLVELGRPVDRAPLVAEILFGLERRYDGWARGAAP